MQTWQPTTTGSNSYRHATFGNSILAPSDSPQPIHPLRKFSSTTVCLLQLARKTVAMSLKQFWKPGSHQANHMTRQHTRAKILDQDCPSSPRSRCVSICVCGYQISFPDTFICMRPNGRSVFLRRSIETVTLTDCLTVHSSQPASSQRGSPSEWIPRWTTT